MTDVKHIALLVDASRAYGRGICTGVSRFAMERDDWNILLQEQKSVPDISLWLKRNKVDGIIAFIPDKKLGKQLKAARVPVVDVHGQGNCPGVPVFDTDPYQTARLVADFFMQAGFTHYAFCGYPGIYFSDCRESAFAGTLREHQAGVYSYMPRPKVRNCTDLFQRERGTAEREDDLSSWLVKLPKPVAVFACNDIRGQQVINACRTSGISVPEQVSVISVDNDEIVCELCRPKLSSVMPDTKQIGYSAARALSALLEGGAGECYLHNIPPLRIVERQSADILNVDDARVMQAERLIRDRSCSGQLSLDMLCEAAGCSRSTLDSLFKKHLGHPVSREIIRIRLGRSKRLLLDSDLSIDAIARQCGFFSATYFCRFFKRETGTTPARFRDSRK